MRRVMYIGGTVVLSGLSAFGATKLVLGLDLGSVLATLACIAAFLSNFFLIDGLSEQIVRR